MAAGDIRATDNAYLTIGGTDVSAYVSAVNLQLTHPEVAAPHTFGQAGPLRAASRKYDYTLEVTFYTDAWGAASVDAIITALMRPPLGSGTGLAAVVFGVDGSTASANNPHYKFGIVLSQWQPLGGGQVNEPVMQTRTYNGNGALAKATS